MTRILLLTPQLPYPPEQGTSLRNYNILRGLLCRYQVTLLSFVTEAPSIQALDRLSGCQDLFAIPVPQRSLSTRLSRMILDRRPDMAHRLYSEAFVQQLSGLLRQGGAGSGSARQGFDVAQVEGIELSYAIDIIRAESPSSRIVFDDHNAEHELQRRAYLADRTRLRRLPAAIYSMSQAGRLRSYERRVCDAADHVVAVSENDRRSLEELGVRAPISVIPNSIDVREYAPEKSAEETYDLVFVGKMDYRPNVDAVLWFATEIWPLIRERHPDVTWAIVGKNPHPRLDWLRDQEGITITGRVEKVQPYLLGGRVFLMPFRVGGGTRLKLIEAMASGRAIVSTTIGAEGFSLTPGKQLLLADTPADFAAAVLSLLEDTDRRQELGHSALTFSEQYDWRQVTPLFYDIIDQLVEVD